MVHISEYRCLYVVTINVFGCVTGMWIYSYATDNNLHVNSVVYNNHVLGVFEVFTAVLLRAPSLHVGF